MWYENQTYLYLSDFHEKSLLVRSILVNYQLSWSDCTHFFFFIHSFLQYSPNEFSRRCCSLGSPWQRRIMLKWQPVVVCSLPLFISLTFSLLFLPFVTCSAWTLSFSCFFFQFLFGQVIFNKCIFFQQTLLEWAQFAKLPKQVWVNNLVCTLINKIIFRFRWRMHKIESAGCLFAFPAGSLGPGGGLMYYFDSTAGTGYTSGDKNHTRHCVKKVHKNIIILCICFLVFHAFKICSFSMQYLNVLCPDFFSF